MDISEEEGREMAKKGKKIVLIQPKNIFGIDHYPPLSIILLGTSLKNNGFKVKLISNRYSTRDDAFILSELEDAFMVGFTTLTSEAMEASRLAGYIRKSFPNIVKVWGGWHATLFPEQIAESDLSDFVVTGEGDYIITELAEKVVLGNRHSEKILQTGDFLDIEKLPAPDYSLIEDLEYFINQDLLDIFQKDLDYKMRWLPYQSSRGCPHKCAFCINVVTDNQRYRAKSAEKTLDEINMIVDRYNINHIKIIDDNFFSNPKRVYAIAKGLIDLNRKITWDAECRVDYFKGGFIDDELLKILKESGLVQLTLGIESGSQNMLGIMKKDQIVEMAIFAVSQCEKYKIYANSSFMLNVPGETIEDVKKTIKFVERLRRYRYFTCGVATYRPYPKSELTEKLVSEGRFQQPDTLDGWSNERVIRIFTQNPLSLPWTDHSRYASRVTHYLSLESGIRLRDHFLKTKVDKLINRIMISIAKFRNRIGWHNLTVDRWLFEQFKREKLSRRL